MMSLSSSLNSFCSPYKEGYGRHEQEGGGEELLVIISILDSLLNGLSHQLIVRRELPG